MERLALTTRGKDLVLNGELDSATAARLIEAVQATRGDLRLDLRDCTFMDSSGISALIDTRRHAEAVSATLVLVAPSEPVIRLLKICGLDDTFTIEPSSVPI